MSKRAIVILYEGSEPSDGAKTAISRFLCDYGVVKLTGNIQQNIEIYCITEKEIIAAIAAKPISSDSNFFTVETVKNEPITPEAEAVLIISNNFKEIIVKGDMLELYYAMCNAAMISKYRQPNQPLDRAITLLASPDIINHLAFNDEKDVKLWTDILNVVRRVYDSVYNV